MSAQTLAALTASAQQQQQQQHGAHTTIISNNAEGARLLQCGVVYSWQSADESYVVECALCETHPFCRLAEFTEHMEICHSGSSVWQTLKVNVDETRQLEEMTHNISELERSVHEELMVEVLAELAADAEKEHEKEFCDVDGAYTQQLDVAAELVQLPAEKQQHAQLYMLEHKAVKLPETTTTTANNVHALPEFVANLSPTTEGNENLTEITASNQEMCYKILAVENTASELLTIEQLTDISNLKKPNAKNGLKVFMPAVEEASLLDVVTMETENILTPHSDFSKRIDKAASTNISTDTVASESTFDAFNTVSELIDGSVLLTPKSITPARSPAPLTPTTPLAIAKLSAGEQVDYGFHAYADKKLSTQRVVTLIELYRAHPRLWNQSHAEFRDTELCRKSWQEITDQWNSHCERKFTVPEVRIRVSTLCQRFLKTHERLEAEGELDECVKFVHYDKLKFLVEQQTLQHRRVHFERENRQLVEIYTHYPLLWHNAHKHVRCPEKREAAHRSISTALKLYGINLSPFGVQRRIQSLRKCYRLEKIRYLHCMLEGKLTLATSEKDFETDFVHYHDMAFLHQHIDPYVCAGCGKIFENWVSYREHSNVSNANEECWEEFQRVQQAPSEVEDEEEQEPENKKVQTKTQIKQTMAQPEVFDSKELPTVAPAAATTAPELLVKVDCEKFSYNLRLKDNEAQKKSKLKDEKQVRNSIDSGMDDDEHNDDAGDGDCMHATSLYTHSLRLPAQQAHKLIALYKAQPALWDPNHLDYHSRPQRRLAWHALTMQMNRSCKKRFSWQTLHRKLTDYAKYYRREKTRSDKRVKWCFYDDFRFLDDALIVNNEIQKTLQHPDSNLKIIEMYQAQPQLWCTDHPDYTKRKQRQRLVESICTRLQDECNIQITTERLKHRIIEFRYQYRQAKQQRLQANASTWKPNYVYYEVLSFLDQHVAPFVCIRCNSSFKKRTDYLQHEQLAHSNVAIAQQQSSFSASKRRRRTRHTTKHCDNVASATATAAVRKSNSSAANNGNDHICHICGMKFSMRNNLHAHLKRHLGQRTHACSLCPKKFFNSTALNVHMRSHTKEQPYVCEVCARGFVNASKLNQHLKRHRHQRDYPCNRCDKAFYSAFERDRHVRSHLNIRDKICPICGRAFVVGSAYYAHMNLHRDTKRYSCEKCDKRFAQYAGLYKHRKRCTADPVQASESVSQLNRPPVSD